MDAHDPACADEDVLGSVGEAYDFVRDHLADGEDEVMAAVAQQLVDLGGPGVVQLAFRDFKHEGAGDFAQSDNVIAPVVDAEQVARRGAEHGRDFLVGHGLVGAEGRQDVDELFSVVLVCQFRQHSGLRVHAGEVGRDRENTLAVAESVQRGEEAGFNFGGGQLCFG